MNYPSIYSKKNGRKQKTIIRFLFVAWFVASVYWIYDNYDLTPSKQATVRPKKPISPLQHVDVSKFTQFISSAHPKHFNSVDLFSDPGVVGENYKEILLNKSTENDNLFNSNLNYVLRKYNFQERCDLYFNVLYQKKLAEENSRSYLSSPIINPHRSFHFDRGHNRGWEEYKKEEIKKLKEEREKENEEKNDGEKDEVVVTEEEVAEMKTKYDEIQALIAEEDQILHDYMTHVKVFNKCFVTDDSPHSNSSDFVAGQQKKLSHLRFTEEPDRKFPNKQKQIYSNVRHLESLLYPWLTQRSPIFEPVNGKRYTLFKSLYPFVSSSFLNNFRKKLNGRGIVLTMADSHVDSAVRLFHLLRSLDTKLPIQIIYQPDNLSDDSKFQLIQATTSKFFDYSTLDLTFVNVKPAIDKEYRDKFSGFGNKILAVLFNSFEEMIFLDADAVVTKSPEEFFRLKKYVRSGTLFYKDRATVEYRPESDITFFKKLMNTQMDEIFFGMDQVTNKTMQLPFFSQRMSHFMESGLVLIDRRRHFQQPLIMSLMNFYETVKSRIYGDKELFWLSLALSGDESFEFNKHFAAAIGEITPLKERLKDIGKTQTILSREICSNHPAHISDEDNRTLLWFNSGYQFCNQLENIDFGREASDKKRYSKFKSTKQFEKFFRSQLSVKAAIIPPSKKLEADNNLGEPSRAWVNMRQYCDGYTWCGYSSIGAGTSEDEQGTVIEFTALETNKYEKLGKIWMNDFDYRTYKQLDIDDRKQQDSPNPKHSRTRHRELLRQQYESNRKNNVEMATSKSSWWSIL